MCPPLALWSLAAMLAPPVAGSDNAHRLSAGEELVVVQIVDIEQVHEYTAAVSPSTLRLVGSRRATPPEETRRKALADILRAMDRSRQELAIAPADCAPARGQPVSWKHASPDGLHALVGYESPLDVRRSAAVARAQGTSEPWPLELAGYLDGSLWSSDSKTVLLLESTERWLKSPRGLLRIMVGHPVPLDTLFLTACHVETRRCERIQIAADIEFATAHLKRANAEVKEATP